MRVESRGRILTDLGVNDLAERREGVCKSPSVPRPRNVSDEQPDSLVRRRWAERRPWPCHRKHGVAWWNAAVKAILRLGLVRVRVAAVPRELRVTPHVRTRINRVRRWK